MSNATMAEPVTSSVSSTSTSLSTAPTAVATNAAAAAASSWIEIPANCDFSIDNIPFGICSFPPLAEIIPTGEQAEGCTLVDNPVVGNNNAGYLCCSLSPTAPRCCTAIGRYVVDLALLAEAGLLDDLTIILCTTTTSNDSKDEEMFSITNFHPRYIFSRPQLNEFMSCSKPIWVAVRNRLICLFLSERIIRPGNNGGGSSWTTLVPDSRLRTNMALRNQAFHLHTETKYHLPANIGDYTDFYSSREHATNVGIMFRGKEHALQPNWLHMPIGYHGRSSSIYPSVACGGCGGLEGSIGGGGGEDHPRMSTIRRPYGQIQLDPLDPTKGSTYGPSKLLDFELEVAFFVGGPTNHDDDDDDDDVYHHNSISTSRDEVDKREFIGRPLTFQQAKDRIFGYVLMNDWSARDIQKWEYVPLGPFTSKNFATTISTWVVTPMALEPYRCETSAGRMQGGRENGGGDPIPLEYLRDDDYGSYDVNLSVSLQPKGSSSSSYSNITQICQSNLKNLYWSSVQQLVHHSVTGCPMKAGDLLASGTISGKEPNSFGSMLELSWNGTRDILLQNGEVRKFLEDGDAVIIEGSCVTKEGWGRVGFGQCSGRVLPAIPSPDIEFREAVKKKEVLATQPPQPKYTNFQVWGFMGSSCTWRVRIALFAKGIRHEMYLQDARNWQGVPMNSAPFLEFVDSGRCRVRITQSLAIIEFLESAYPNQGVPLLPSEPVARAKAKEVAEIVLSRIVPFQSMTRVDCLDTIDKDDIDDQENLVFAIKNVKVGLDKLEDTLTPFHTLSEQVRGACDAETASTIGGPYAIGTHGPTLADICLVTQLFDARRLGIDICEYPTLKKINDACADHHWFGSATYPEYGLSLSQSGEIGIARDSDR